MKQVEVEPGRVLVVPEVGLVYRRGKSRSCSAGRHLFSNGALKKR